MKKILIMLLLIFPILIFAVVSFTSTIISYYVPIAVNELKIIKGRDIISYKLNEEHDLEFEINPKNSRNNSFFIYDDLGRTIIDYNDKDNEKPIINNYLDQIIDLNINQINKGNISLKATTKNYGFTKLTIVSKDGNYKTQADIYVTNEEILQDEIQGLVFDYSNIYNDYKFGNKNDIKLNYTYYPKKALDSLPLNDQDRINTNLKNNALELEFNQKNIIIRNNEVLENGKGQLTLELKIEEEVFIESKNLIKNDKYNFKVFEGYNIYNYNDLNNYKSKGNNLFLLDNINMNEPIVFSNGTKLYGNNYKLDYSNYINDKNNILYLLEFNGNNSGIYNTHIQGPLDENNLPYDNIINLGMIAKNNNDRYMEVKDNIIENGRFNLTIIGYANTNEDIKKEDKATKYLVENNTFSGSYLSSIEVDSKKVDAYLYYATEVDIINNKINYTAIGLTIQNSKSEGGIIKVNLINKDNNLALNSNSWRNLDDATGALDMNNLGYLLKELKSDKYQDVYKKIGKNYYVNPLIMLRGGYINRGILNIEDEELNKKIILKTRIPNFIEAMHPSVGGTYPFQIYLVNPKYYGGYME